jgi:hypothetical protein
VVRSPDASILRSARRAGVLVSTSREPATIAESSVCLDALAGSATDSAERYDTGALPNRPRLVVLT